MACPRAHGWQFHWGHEKRRMVRNHPARMCDIGRSSQRRYNGSRVGKKKKKKPQQPKSASRSDATQTPLSDQKNKERPLPNSQDSRPAPSQGPLKPTQIRNQRRHWKRWVTGWHLAAELVTMTGLVIAIYALHPVLSVISLEPSDLHGSNGVKASISLAGTRIRDVKIQCVTNTVIFEDQGTLKFNWFTRIDEYSVRDVAVGESLTADCNFAWSLWTKPAGGFFLMGGGVPAKPQLGIPFEFKDGLPSLIPGAPLPAAIMTDLKGYVSANIAAIDGYFIVVYKCSLCWWSQQRRIHLIARRSDERLKWHVAPNSEPIIPYSTGGFIVTANGPPDRWAVTMGPGVPPQ